MHFGKTKVMARGTGKYGLPEALPLRALGMRVLLSPLENSDLGVTHARPPCPTQWHLFVKKRSKGSASLLVRPFPNGPLVKMKLGSVWFFFWSNLGSGRSQQGQGIAQCDTAYHVSWLHPPPLPRDSICSKIPTPEVCYH